MDADQWRRHRLLNALQSFALLAAMAGLLATLGWAIAGGLGVLWAMTGGVALVIFSERLSPRLILRMYGAGRVQPGQAPGLYAALVTLTRRAGLEASPTLYYVPSQMLNAFAVGSRTDYAIAVTDGLLRSMHPRELAGVLAHEIAHVAHNDIWVMGLADLFSRLTSLFALLGTLTLLLTLPLALLGGYSVSWPALLVLILAPSVSALIQLALSRTREYDADMSAVALTGDPRGLAMALERMKRYEGRFLEQIFLPGRQLPEPSLLRTHPSTAERIARLLDLERHRPAEASEVLADQLPRPHFPAARRRPRWHANGLWY